MASRRLKAVFVLIVLVILLPGDVARAQNWSAVVGPTGKIPEAKYKSWSLFLVCNPEWLSAERGGDLEQLYYQFINFGRAIGDDHDAVWFWRSAVSLPNPGPGLGAKVDVERSAKFCKAFNIKPSSSPSVLITDTYPDPAKPSKKYAVYELGGMKPNDISALLASVTDQLLLQGKVSPPTNDASVSDGIFARLKLATEQLAHDFQCQFSFEITTGPVKTKVNPCPKAVK